MSRLAAPSTDQLPGLATCGRSRDAGDVQWVADRCGPFTPELICAIESARGLLAAQEIASVAGVRHLSIGGVDLRRDLNTGDGDLPMLHARSHLVVVSRAVGLAPPIDCVYARLDDQDGMRERTEFGRSLGFFGKSAIHPPPTPRATPGLRRSRTRSRGRKWCSTPSQRPAAGRPGSPTASSST